MSALAVAILVLGPAVVTASALAGSWSGDVVLEGSREVPAGTTLVVQPGTRISSTADGATLAVEGRLWIQGTKGEPVRVGVPVRVQGGPATAVLVQNATLAPGLGSGCALSLPARVPALVETTTLREAGRGLCVQPASQVPPEVGQGSRSPTGDRGSASSTLTGLLDDPSIGEGANVVLPLPREPGIGLSGVRLVDHREVGLDIADAGSRVDVPPALEARNLTVSGNPVGIRTVQGAPLLDVADASIVSNGVGIESRGGQVRLDHARLAGNERWDVYSTEGSWDVQWTGSTVGVSCTHVGDRPTHGCQRGGVANATLMAIVFGTLYALVYLLSEAGRYLLVRVGVGLGLYSRIPREDLLDEETRGELFALLEEEPGLHLREIVRQMDAGYGRIAYHLARLENADFVTSQREGVYRRFYARDDGPGDREPRSTRDEVLETIRQEPGIYAAEIARELGTSRQLVTYHVRELVGLAKVEERRGKNCKRLFPTEG